MTPTATNGQPEASDPAPALDLPLENDAIADRLDEIGHLLAEQEANPFRVRAYREAARTLRGLRRPAVRILEREGTAGLEDLPGIGEALASAIDQLARTGRLGLLDQLRGESSPEAVLATVPGIGKTLAHRLHEELGITTLAELEEAAHDGRLREMEGFGSERIRGVRESLAGRFGPGGRRTPARPPRPHPGVAEILDVDREYRGRAAAEDLPRIAPRRFNPTREAWLPILHTKRGPRHYTALYSNTARAHALWKTQDWVVIYQDDHDPHRQWTVVTSGRGPLRGRRVVRGRETECADLYAAPGKD